MAVAADLLGELSLHFLLEPAQQEGPEHFVQTTDDQDGLFLVQVHLRVETVKKNGSRITIP